MQVTHTRGLLPAPKDRPPLPDSALEYVEQMEGAAEEPLELHGLVFQQYDSGAYRILKKSGETTPDVPPSGPDIPADAVKNNRVVISIDGIIQSWDTHRDQIRRFFHTQPGDTDAGIHVGQPVIGIHEGTGATKAADNWRMARDVLILKSLQNGAPTGWVRRTAYANDPAVKAAHDELSQCLQLGRDIQLIVHSGGGGIASLALAILAREGYRDLIANHVRVLALAPATSAKDLEMAGVKSENILYTGSRNDGIWNLFHRYLHLVPQILNLPNYLMWAWVSMTRSADDKMAYHSPGYILAANLLPDGTNRLQHFVNGAPGGDYPLP